MVKPASILGLLLASTWLSACGLLSTPPVIETRFKVGDQAPAPTAPPHVSLKVSSAAAKGGGDSDIALTSLSDRGQAALIDATKGAPPIKLSDQDGGASRYAAHDTVKRTIVVAVQPDDFLAPGDRIDAIQISIEVAPNQKDAWTVASWSQATNGVVVLDVGKLTDTTSSKITGETGLKLDHALPDAKVGAEFDRSRAREFDIKDTTEFNAAVSDRGVAWLNEVAGWRENLDHNLSIDVVLAASPDHMRDTSYVHASALTKSDGKSPGGSAPSTPAEVSLTDVLVNTPFPRTTPICGLAKLRYRIRHITDAKAAATFTESDDPVEARATNSDDVTFLLAPPTLEPGYGLFTGADRDLLYEAVPGHPVALQFQTITEALKFRDWLRTMAPKDGKIANATLGLIDRAKGFQPLTPAQAKQLLAGALDSTEISDANTLLRRGCPVSAEALARPAPR